MRLPIPAIPAANCPRDSLAANSQEPHTGITIYSWNRMLQSEGHRKDAIVIVSVRLTAVVGTVYICLLGQPKFVFFLHNFRSLFIQRNTHSCDPGQAAPPPPAPCTKSKHQPRDFVGLGTYLFGWPKALWAAAGCHSGFCRHHQLACGVAPMSNL